MTAGQARDALADLQFHWGSAYAIAGAAGCVVPAHLVPVPLGAARQRPAEALERLSGQLPEGTRTTLRTDGVLAVLSTPAASIWSNGRVMWWATADGEVTWPAADAEGAARRLARPIT